MTAFVRGISPSDRQGTIDKDGNRDYTIKYKVYTDDKADGPQVVRKAFGIPEIGSAYAPAGGNDFDLPAICKSKTVEPTDSPYEWIVECHYSSKIESSGGGGTTPPPEQNPLTMPPEISFTFQTNRILIPDSYNQISGPHGESVWGLRLPTAEPFANCGPSPEMDWDTPILIVKRNYSSAAHIYLMDYANKVNADSWQGATRHQLKIISPSAQSSTSATYGTYWQITWQIAFKWDTWDIKLLNAGSYYWPGGTPVDWNNPNKHPTVPKNLDGSRKPVLLAANGDKLADNAIPTFTTIQPYREIYFSSLGILP